MKIKRLEESGRSAKMLKEGEQLKLMCEANGNPANFQFNWKVDGQEGKLNI